MLLLIDYLLKMLKMILIFFLKVESMVYSNEKRKFKFQFFYFFFFTNTVFTFDLATNPGTD